jgi:Ca2+-binding RTX toxin-like protein
MPTMTGTAGADTLVGTAGDDTLQGLDGADSLTDRLGGSDLLLGGAGDDSVNVTHTSGVTNVTVDGGTGDDTIWVFGPSPLPSGATPPSGVLNVNITGGDGADSIATFDRCAGTIDAGAGNDFVQIDVSSGQGLTVTLGAGVDTLRLGNPYFLTAIPNAVTVTDFQPGAGGDVVDLQLGFRSWDGGNLFAEGYLHLAQGPNGAVLQYDPDGGGDSYSDVAIFRGTDVAQFTAANFGGMDPSAPAPVGKVITGSTVFGNENLFGTSGSDTINGLLLNDVIHAGAGNDLIDGGPGNDTIFGEAGDDTVTGGTGDDTLTGGEGDILRGQDGNDRLSLDGSSVKIHVTLDGGTGDDTLTLGTLLAGQTAVGLGGDGRDLIQIVGGAGGAATVDAGAGDDVISFLGAGTDATLTLGSGMDIVRFEKFSDLPHATITDFAPGLGGDRLQLFDFLQQANPDWDPNTNPFDGGFIKLVSSGASTIVQLKVGGALQNALVLQGVPAGALQPMNFEGYAPGGGPSVGWTQQGGAGADSLVGGSGGDSLSGMDGADSLSGGLGADTLDGGNGDDTLDGGAGLDVVHGGAGDDRISAFSSVGGQFFGESGADSIFISSGTPGASFLIDGGDGADQLTFSGGFPATQSVTMLGGDGDDQLSVFGGADDVIDAGAGSDQLFLGGALGKVQVTLGSGNDLLRIQGFFAPFGTVTVTDFAPGDRLDLNLFENATASGDVHPSFLLGTLRLAQQGADSIFQFNPDGQGLVWTTVVDLQGVNPTSLDSVAIGEDPIVRFTLGGDGADTLTTSAAFEGVDGGAGADSLTGDAQANRLWGGAGDDTVMAGAGSDTISDSSGSNYLRGEDGDDSISGGNGFDDINGNMGNDTAHGNAGDDWVVGGKNDDMLFGDAGDDIVWGNLGNDTLDGGAGDDQVRGGQGDDVIQGGAGNDYVSGDRGNDTISGGPGADLFHGSQDAGIDRVLDFHALEGDRVMLDPGTTYTVSQVGADTVIDMGGSNQMILVGVQLSSLPSGWIFLG